MAKWVFIHIPKTAGKAFSRAIFPPFGMEYEQPWLAYDFFVRDRDARRDPFLAGHAFYPIVKVIFPQDTQFITLLRDPIDRAYSHWEHVRREPLHYFHDFVRDMTVSEFIRHPATLPLVNNLHARYLTITGKPPESIGPIEYQKYYELKTVTSEYLFEEALDTLYSFAMVGLQEWLPESVAQACKIMGLDPPTVDQKETPNYRERMSGRDLAYLEHINEIDIALYEEFRARFKNEVFFGGYHPRIKAREFRPVI